MPPSGSPASGPHHLEKMTAHTLTQSARSPGISSAPLPVCFANPTPPEAGAIKYRLGAISVVRFDAAGNRLQWRPSWIHPAGGFLGRSSPVWR